MGADGRAVSAGEAFRTALDLFEAGVALQRQNLRRQYPAARDEEIDRRLGRWLRHRPGAEDGDGSGRRVVPADRFA